MAVNGIEIKVGQVWRTRSGDNIRVVGYTPGDRHCWLLEFGLTVDDHGCPVSVPCAHDLIELISEADGPQEIHFEPGDASTLAVEMLTDLGWVFTDGVWVQEQPLPVKQTAPGLLAKAAKIMSDRAATYDQPDGERSMGKTVAAFNVITGRDLSESEGWLLMQVLKDVRDRQRAQPHADSLEDGIAYSALKAEARLAEKQKE